VFVKRNGALGMGANNVASGGTLGFRTHVGWTLNYNHADVQAIQVSGLGAVRAWGQPAVGAIYHDGGNNIFTGDIQLLGHTTIGARGDAGGLTLSGQITGNYWFGKVGSGLITLSNANNNWGGFTEIFGGVLRITHNNAIPSRIYLKGGILELGGGNFQRTLGSGIQWGEGSGLYPNGGGFSAFGGNRTVSILNAQGNLANLTWGTGGFVGNNNALLLSSRYANAIIDFKNPINLNSGTREVRVERGHTNAYAIISGSVTGTGGNLLVKTGPGMLWFQGGIGSEVRIDEGAVRGYIENALWINGGVLGLDSNYIRPLGGSGGGSTRWIGSGGFAAYGGDRLVRFNNGDTLNWGNWGGTTNFVENGQELRFGHYTADGTVGWFNPINLGFFARIHVEQGRNSEVADVVFAGALSSPASFGDGGTGELTIKGNGRMDLRSASTSLEVGVINVYGAELRLNLGGRIDAGNNPHHTVSLAYGGTLTLDNLGNYNSTTGGLYVENRLPYSAVDSSSIDLQGGTFRFWGRSRGDSKQQLSGLILNRGANTIDIQNNSTGTSSFTEVRAGNLFYFNFGPRPTLNYITNTENFSKARLSFANWDSTATRHRTAASYELSY